MDVSVHAEKKFGVVREGQEEIPKLRTFENVMLLRIMTGRKVCRSERELTSGRGEDGRGKLTDNRPRQAGEVTTVENKPTAPPGGGAIDYKVPCRTREQILRLTLTLHAFRNPIWNDWAVMHRGAQLLQKDDIPWRVRHEIRQHAINFRPTPTAHI